MTVFSIPAGGAKKHLQKQVLFLTNIWFYVDNQKATCYNEPMRKFA
jgi:hypothetical protein